MRLKFQVPTNLDVENVKWDDAKKELSMDLIFYGPTQESAAGTFEVEAFDTTRIFRGVLSVSGASGRPAITPRTESVLSAVEEKIKAGEKISAGKSRRKKEASAAPAAETLA